LVGQDFAYKIGGKDSQAFALANSFHEKISSPLFISALIHELRMFFDIVGIAKIIKKRAKFHGKDEPGGVDFEQQATAIIANSPYLQIMFDQLNIDVRNFFIVVYLSPDPFYGSLLILFKSLITRISSNKEQEKIKKSIAVELVRMENKKPGTINIFAAQGLTDHEQKLAKEIADMARSMLVQDYWNQ
jgi:hypothetical protein